MGNAKYTIIRSGELPVSRWSGGTTTQLAIYPPHADYAARNFVWRVSTATVEAPESLFTALPGVSRKIMVLEGRMTLAHEGRYTKELGRGEQDAFSGDWTTRSRGRVRDFNVMTTEGESSLEMLEAEAGEVIAIAAGCVAGSGESLVLYFLSQAEIEVSGQNNTLHAMAVGDVFVSTTDADATTEDGGDNPNGCNKPLSLGLRNPSSALRVVVARVRHS